MAFSFENFLFTRLPSYFKRLDSYKDSNDRGLLERYLKVFGLELDGELIPLIENYTEIISPLETNAKYLTTLAYTLGSPPDLFLDDEKYAKFLSHIMSVYKIKGTAKSYELFFAILGFLVTITEHDPAVLRMDDGNIMDDGLITLPACPTCSDYSLTFSDLLNPGDGDCTTPVFGTAGSFTIEQIRAVIKFIEPINAELRALIRGGWICDLVSYCYDDALTINILHANSMDTNLIMDDSELMDNPHTVATSNPTAQTCFA